MKKYVPIQIKSSSLNIQRLLVRFCCSVFFLMMNSTLIFGQGECRPGASNFPECCNPPKGYQVDEMAGASPDAAPTISISENITICSGNSTILNAFSPVAILYSWSPAMGLNVTTGANVQASPNITTIYTVTSTNTNGCTSTARTTVTVNYPDDGNPCTTDACNTADGVITNTPYSVSATATQGDILCYGGSTCVTVTSMGGLGAITYSNGVSTNATGVFCGYGAGGSYNFSAMDANGCSSPSNPVVITQPSKLEIDSISSTPSGCISNDGTATVYPSGGTGAYTYLWSPGGQTTNPAVGLGGGSYCVVVKDANGCPSLSTCVTVGSGCAIVNIRVHIQGYYIGNGQMTPVMYNQFVPGTTDAQVDTVIVELRSTADFSNIVDSYKAVMDTGGNVTGSMAVASIGSSYYLVIRHRSALFTCSANPVLLSAVTGYDFTLSAATAFGSNEIDLGDGYFALFNGDINQDEYIDTGDVTIVDNDNLSGLHVPGAGAYWITDINGDGYVDTGDVTEVDNNNLAGVFSQHP